MDLTTPLARLAALHGVATQYESSGHEVVEVDDEVVVAVLALLDVDASGPTQVAAALEAATAEAEHPVPATVVVPEGTSVTVAAGTLTLEDGTELSVGAGLPDDLPLGYHQLAAAGRTATVLVVPSRLDPVPLTWGWMLQLYSLHSHGSWGMGDYRDLTTVVERSAQEQGAGVVLVNPVDLPGPVPPVEASPYSPSSRRFANPLYLRIEDVAAYDAADPDTRAAVDSLRVPSAEGLIDYDAVWDAKRAALELLWPFARHTADATGDVRTAATYLALAERHGNDWRQWPEALQEADGPAVADAADELADRVAFHAWVQGLCREQLALVRQASHGAGMAVGVVHDLPVGVAAGGADTWSAPHLFAMGARVGSPPDAFNDEGQDWGLPPWRPDRLAEAGYAPLREVVRAVLEHGDGIRVDHVAGLWRLWWVPPGEPASRGTYVHYDADAMVGVLTLEAKRAGAVVVGEDLGTIEPVVTETLHERGALASAVLWFERDWDEPGRPFRRPQDWDESAMASITTHDLPTAAGWLSGENVRVRARLGLLAGDEDAALAESAQDRQALLSLADQEGVDTTDEVVAQHALLARAACRLVLSAPADALGQLEQPNLPGTVDAYPSWRIPLSVSLEDFFEDPRVESAIAPLRAARSPQDGRAGDGTHTGS